MEELSLKFVVGAEKNGIKRKKLKKSSVSLKNLLSMDLTKATLPPMHT